MDGQTTSGTAQELAIGTVDTAEGSVFVIRADGTRVELEAGEPVYEGDIIETGDGGMVHVTFADESTFSLGENGVMTLDNLVYDASSGAGEAAFSVAKGVFVFASGMIAKTSPDAMVVNTPTTTIGVRGTKVAGEVEAEGSETVVTLLLEEDGQTGEIVVLNDGGVQVVNQAFQTVRIESFDAAPSLPEFITEAELEPLYGDDIGALIDGPRAAEEDHTEIEALAEFETASPRIPRPPSRSTSRPRKKRTSTRIPSRPCTTPSRTRATSPK